MATVEDNVLNEDGKLKASEDAVRNGVHAADVAPKAAKPHAMTATEAIIRQGQDARDKALTRLHDLDEERVKLVAFLGVDEKPKRGRRALTIGSPGAEQIDALEEERVSSPARPVSKSTAKRQAIQREKPAAKARAKRTENVELENEKAHVLGILKRSDAPMSVSNVAEATGLESKNASRALKALRLEKKIASKGEARGTKYTAK